MSSPNERARALRGPTALALVLALALGAAVAYANGADVQAMLVFLVGLAIGATLLGADFGFAGGFRRVAAGRDFSGLRAHLITFAIAMVLMVPMVAAGSVFGRHVEGFAHGVGVAFLIGAVLFGAGMQLAGGCASGTLYQLGGGDAKYLGTLAGFVVGSVLAASQIGLWWSLPALPAVTLFTLGPWPIGLAISLAAMALLFRALGGAMPPRRLVIGGALLALSNAATLLVAGRPWSETWAFTIWGSQLAARLGAHPDSWRFFRDAPYDTNVLVDRTSIMDTSIIVGAFLAASLLGRFALRRAAPRALVAATLGGLAMGYGARLSGGCNIGAYFSAIATGDLSGWAWALAALGGSWVGLQLRARIEPPSAPADAPSALPSSA